MCVALGTEEAAPKRDADMVNECILRSAGVAAFAAVESLDVEVHASLGGCGITVVEGYSGGAENASD